MIKRFDQIEKDKFEKGDIVYYIGDIKKVYGERAEILYGYPNEFQKYAGGAWKIKFFDEKYGNLPVKEEDISKDPPKKQWWHLDEQMENYSDIFKIGDEVLVNGDVDGRMFSNIKDFISDVCINPAGSYRGEIFKLRNSNWWVPPFVLTRDLEIKRIFNRIDPYGEENWNA